MSTKIRVARAGELAPGAVQVVQAGERALALCNVDGTLYAVDQACPHRGGPLGEGDLEGPILTCPWHGWRWDVRTGASTNHPTLRLGCVPVSLEGGEIFVTL